MALNFLKCRKLSLCSVSKCAAQTRSSVNFQLMKNSLSWKKRTYTIFGKIHFSCFSCYCIKYDLFMPLKFNLKYLRVSQEIRTSLPLAPPFILSPSHSLEVCQAPNSNHSQPASLYPEGSQGPSCLVSSRN